MLSTNGNENSILLNVLNIITILLGKNINYDKEPELKKTFKGETCENFASRH
jgi:hypothetical protein